MRCVPADIGKWIEENKGLLYRWVVRRDREVLSEEDAYAEALLGVARAMTNYDPSRGSWNTHVWWQIRGEISGSAFIRRRRRTKERTTECQLIFDVAAAKDDPGPKDTTHVYKALKKLSKRDRDVICRYFGLDGHAPETYGEIAESYGLTKERIRQIAFRALGRLRKQPELQAEVA